VRHHLALFFLPLVWHDYQHSPPSLHRHASNLPPPPGQAAIIFATPPVWVRALWLLVHVALVHFYYYW